MGGRSPWRRSPTRASSSQLPPAPWAPTTVPSFSRPCEHTMHSSSGREQIHMQHNVMQGSVSGVGVGVGLGACASEGTTAELAWASSAIKPLRAPVSTATVLKQSEFTALMKISDLSNAVAHGVGCHSDQDEDEDRGPAHRTACPPKVFYPLLSPPCSPCSSCAPPALFALLSP